MSLKVWLPCNKGNLNNYGLDETISISSSSASSDNNGIIGKCMKVTTAVDLKVNGNIINTSDLSFGGWFKFNQSEIASVLSSKTYTSTAKYATGNLIGNNSYGGIGLTWISNEIYTDGSFSKIYVLPSVRTSTLGLKTGTSYQIPFDTWVHIYLTFSQGEKLKMYINGVETSSVNISSFSDALSRNLHINGGWVYGGNGPAAEIPFYINNIKVCDELLDPFVIKEDSLGLAVHYPLNDTCLENTTNLITTEDGLTNTCYNGATSKYNYGTTTDMYKTVGDFQGKKCTKVYMGTSGLSAWPYVYFSIQTAVGQTKSLSFDYYPTIQNTVNFYNLSTNTSLVYNINGVQGTANNTVTMTVNLNQWNHIELTTTNTGNASGGMGYMRIGSSAHTSSTSNYWLFANVQVEEKDHPTAYCGAGGSRQSYGCIDVSGFNNHGTVSNYTTIKVLENDTPRYTHSTYIPSDVTISHANTLNNIKQKWTCCAWVKPTSVGSGNIQLNNFNLGNRIVHSANSYPLLYLNSGTNDYYNYGNLAVAANEWTHIAFVFDNANVIKDVYINGQLHTNTGGPNKTSTPSGLPSTVVIGTNFVGYMSDYREYATALSANDIKNLYEARAYMTTDATIYAYEYQEAE